MTFSLVVVNSGGSIGAVSVEDVTTKLQKRFEATKEADPRGYLDAFEQRAELHLAEVVAELGGDVTWRGEEAILNFSSYPSGMVAERVDESGVLA